MNELDLKLYAVAQSIKSKSDVDKMLICKIRALESTLKQHDPKLYEAYTLTLYQMYQETDFSFPINSGHADE